MEKPITTAFSTDTPKAETQMEKTTRIAMRTIEEEAERRKDEIAVLRKARLEMEANTAAETTARTSKKRPFKAAKNR